jgi:tetratricopeptide (TPR) repeat protein
MKLFLTAGAVVCLTLVSARADTFLVLSFSNVSQYPNISWIGESISETVREALARQRLMSIDREDRQEAYRRLGLRTDANPTRATVIKIGQSLDADQVIYGEFDLTPPPAGMPITRGSLKITAHVLDLRHIRQGPEFAEIGALQDLATLQTHLAWQTLQFVSPKTAPNESDFIKEWPQIRVEAIESYIRGLLALSPEQKYGLFSQAVRLAPDYSQSCYQLGMLEYAKKQYTAAADWLQKVTKVDVHYRQALFFSGICRFRVNDYAGAQAAFEQVARDVPLNEVYNNLGAAESRNGDRRALESLSKALEGDSSDPTYHFNYGYELWKEGRFSQAADSFRAVLDRDPQDNEAKIMLGRCIKQNGPRMADLKSGGLERLKTNYEESAYWQLKAVLQPEKK